MIRKKFDIWKFLIKWVFIGVAPLCVVCYYFSIRNNWIFFDIDVLKIILVFSFIPYLFIPWFIKINREIWKMFKATNFGGKIFLIVGLIMLVGRIVWMISHDPTFR